jgi:hypothetical protein
MKQPIRTTLAVVIVAGAAALGAVGCGTLDNPPVTMEPDWDTPRTRQLAVTACFDCHSNQTIWPWYTSLPIVGAIAANNVHEGRQEMNFSTWDRPQKEAGEAGEAIQEGEMPPADYLLMHGEAALSPADKQALVAGLRATFARSPPIPGGNDGGEGGKDGQDDD